MASGTRGVLKVLAGCQRLLLTTGPRPPPARTFAAVKPLKRYGKATEKDKAPKEKKADDGVQQVQRVRVRLPVDDVYVLKHYSQPVYDAPVAVDLLKSFQRLEYTPPDQPVYIDLKLDMKLEKKKRVDPFVSVLTLPHPFKQEMNRVVVFTENPDRAKQAQENGAVLVGGTELVHRINSDEVTADFYLTDPEMLTKLTPLKSKLRKKFPKSKRGTVGVNIPKMLALFKTGHEYLVEDDCYVRTKIGTLDMPKAHILANLQTVMVDVCSHRPASFGHFITRAIIASHTSEALLFHSQDVLPPPPEEVKH